MRQCKDYLTKVIDNVSGYNTTRAENSTFVKIAEEDKKQIVEILNEVINDEKIDLGATVKKSRNMLNNFTPESEV